LLAERGKGHLETGDGGRGTGDGGREGEAMAIPVA
jgi:hypothetical protein